MASRSIIQVPIQPIIEISMTSSNQDINSEKSISDNQEIPTNPLLSESATTKDIPNFGWSSYAERINGRFAMIGFTAILIIEFWSNKAFLDWVGLMK